MTGSRRALAIATAAFAAGVAGAGCGGSSHHARVLFPPADKPGAEDPADQPSASEREPAPSHPSPSHASPPPSAARSRGKSSPPTRSAGRQAARPSGAAGIYAHTAAHDVSAAVRGVPSRIYVPNSGSNTVDVIDPTSYRVIAHYPVGRQPQHVTPSWDLRTLYVDNDLGNSLTPIDPRTGRRKGRAIHVADPYNMYFTPDGRFAIVVAEALHRLDFRDPHTFRLHHALKVNCNGVDHMDFSADGRTLFASCEFSGSMIRVNVAREKVTGRLRLGKGNGAPQDVRLAPGGQLLYVADMINGGVWEVGARSFRVVRFVRTGAGAHGLYPSRDGRELYVTNRGEGTISVVSFARQRVIRKWRLPDGGSPDMGGVSISGHVLWLSGRYNSKVYAIDTSNGHLIASIKVDSGPHGLSVWPQPGRHSLGHTGNMR